MGPAAALDERSAMLAVVAPLRRVVAARVADPTAAEDVVQETLVRLLDRGRGLDDEAVLPYAIVTARNILNSQAEQVWRRHLPKLVDLTAAADPEQEALRREEERALAVALGALSEADRQTLVEHEVLGQDTSALAARSESTPGAVVARLARSRAHLRVDYVCALRRVSPPTPLCRAVLLSLSAGDRRRQRSLHAGKHLLDCPTCASLSEPLLERRRALAGLLVLLLGPSAAVVRRVRTSHPAQVGLAGAAVAVAAVAGIAAMAPDRAQPAPAPSSLAAPAPPAAYLTVDGQPVLPLVVTGRLPSRAEGLARGSSAVVQSSVPGEGFWVGDSTENRVWVEVADLVAGQPTLPTLVPGSRVSFTGRVAANTPEYLAEAREDGIEGVDQIERQGAHIDVLPGDISPG